MKLASKVPKSATPGYSSALTQSGIHTSVCVCVWCKKKQVRHAQPPLQVYLLCIYVCPLSLSLSLYMYIYIHQIHTSYVCMYVCIYTLYM